MEKAEKHRLCQFLHALIEDVCRAMPELRTSLDTDFMSISRRVETRGADFLLVGLPSLGKAFDKGLSSGWFIEPSGLGTLRKGTLPFRCLISQCFSTDGTVYPDVDPEVVFYVRQLCYTFKKLQVKCPDENVRQTVEAFVLTDEGLRLPSVFWNKCSQDSWWDQQRPHFLNAVEVIVPTEIDHTTDLFQSLQYSEGSRYSNLLLGAFQRVCDMVVSTMPHPTWEDLMPKHGPGAVSDLRKGMYKYMFPNWPERLAQVFPEEAFASPWGEIRSELFERADVSVEPCARLLAVPKDYTKPRLITAEPTAHQYCQQAVLHYLRKSFPKILRTCVDFLSQEHSQSAALRASVSGDMATVDLSSASDRLSCWTVERALRTNVPLLSLLAGSRTRFVSDGTKSGAFKYLKLRKFAGQGSAVTFPVQTLIYALAAVTAVLVDEKGLRAVCDGSLTPSHIKKAAGKVRVFGDDLVVPVTALVPLGTLFNHLQLKVNLDKTHMSGHFRESCGMDGYRGVDVTPVYLQRSSSGARQKYLQSWVDTSNNLHKVGLWCAAHWMLEQIPPSVVRLVPVSDSSDMLPMALHTFSSGTHFPGRVRYNTSLHRTEGLSLVPESRSRRMQGGSYRNLLQYFLECKPCSPDTLGDPTFARWSHGWSVKEAVSYKKAWVGIS